MIGILTKKKKKKKKTRGKEIKSRKAENIENRRKLMEREGKTWKIKKGCCVKR